MSESDNAISAKRLEAFIKMYVGCKWTDAGPIEWHQPDGEKYITRESLLKALDEESKING